MKQLDRIKIWNDVLNTLSSGNLSDEKCHCGIEIRFQGENEGLNLILSIITKK